MIPRYSTPEMDAVWSDPARFGRWLEVELLATEVGPRRPTTRGERLAAELMRDELGREGVDAGLEPFAGYSSFAWPFGLIEAAAHNVARGAHVVTEDLIEALQNGAIAGAVLDVAEAERITDTGDVETVMIADLSVGDRVLVRAGSRIPKDCSRSFGRRGSRRSELYSSATRPSTTKRRGALRCPAAS